jgi:hypothetical protein
VGDRRGRRPVVPRAAHPHQRDQARRPRRVLAVKDVQDGKFHGGNAVYGLTQRGVGLGKISPKVPKKDVAAVKRIEAQIVAGKIVPPRIFNG